MNFDISIVIFQYSFLVTLVLHFSLSMILRVYKRYRDIEVNLGEYYKRDATH